MSSMKCMFCNTPMSPLYLPVPTYSMFHGMGTQLEKVLVGMESPYDYTINPTTYEKVPVICSEHLYVCPECGTIKMKIPEEVQEEKNMQGMTIKQRKQYRKQKMEESCNSVQRQATHTPKGDSGVESAE